MHDSQPSPFKVTDSVVRLFYCGSSSLLVNVNQLSQLALSLCFSLSHSVCCGWRFSPIHPKGSEDSESTVGWTTPRLQPERERGKRWIRCRSKMPREDPKRLITLPYPLQNPPSPDPQDKVSEFDLKVIRNGSFQNRPIEEANSQWTKTTLALFRRYFFPWSERGLSHDEPLHHAEAARGWHLRQRAHGPQHWVRRAGGHQEVSGLMLWRLWGVEPRPSM